MNIKDVLNNPVVQAGTKRRMGASTQGDRATTASQGPTTILIRVYCQFN